MKQTLEVVFKPEDAHKTRELVHALVTMYDLDDGDPEVLYKARWCLLQGSFLIQQNKDAEWVKDYPLYEYFLEASQKTLQNLALMEAYFPYLSDMDIESEVRTKLNEMGVG